ncbi:hypothetical protein [Streptomyces yaizuensis]|uniref:Uncharacterized protein n=1 Tax=Streptomyces yaizuensis TaxID=2989713 RepID=A0ABQ5PAV5_9ACTN|nr:hypothetical protein [Streptomyces sp. YSPA8]GLF99714.1 hypothetical protein SYYSPA8_35475 [Streptomyces sp. YSPA8]
MAERGGGLGPVLAVLAVASVAGGLWWWALVRLVAAPERAGPVEAVVLAGGWGLSLLPVHVTAHRGRRRFLGPRVDGPRTHGRRVDGRRGAARGGVERTADAQGAQGDPGGVTRASSRHRSGG